MDPVTFLRPRWGSCPEEWRLTYGDGKVPVPCRTTGNVTVEVKS